MTPICAHGARCAQCDDVEVFAPDNSRSAFWRRLLLSMATLSWLLGGSLACTGEVQADLKVVPPDPVPQPTQAAVAEQPVEPSPPRDEDHDGIADDVDQCVDQQEDGLDPHPKDGCESAAPGGDGGLTGVSPPPWRGSDSRRQVV